MRALLRLLTLVSVSCVALGALAQEPGPDSVQRTKSFERQAKVTVGARYLLFLPKDYDAKSRKTWPLILFLHGSGERGTNLWSVARHGPPKLVKTQADFPFIVVSPQCPSGQTWNNDTLLALLDEVAAHYQVDATRVYLTGLSMGGFGTWSLGLEHPERFAALAPICGGGDPLAVLLADARRAKLIKTLPIWAFHGAKDPVVKLEESQRMVDTVKRAGGDAKLTVYPEAQHDSWTETYNNPELFQWFLAHENQAAGKK